MFIAHIDAEPQRTKENVSKKLAHRLHIANVWIVFSKDLLPILVVFFLIEDEGAMKVGTSHCYADKRFSVYND